MKKAAINPVGLCVLAALGLTLGACQGPELSVTHSSNSPTKVALSPEVAQQVRELEPLFRQPTNLRVTRDSRGTQLVDLQGGFQHAVIVRRNADGTHSVICTDSIDQATEFLARPPQSKVEEQ
jgi:hypothetical protein